MAMPARLHYHSQANILGRPEVNTSYTFSESIWWYPMRRDEQIRPGPYNPSFNLEFDMSVREPLVSMWFELVFGSPRDINLCLGTNSCLLYTSPSPRDRTRSRMPS